MAKTITVLELSGDALRGVRLTEEKGGCQRVLAGSWPLGLPSGSSGNDGSGGADGEATADGEAVKEEILQEDRPLARAFKAAVARFGTHEFALALPLSRLLVKSVRLPVEAKDDFLDAAQAELDGISPFPDEALKPGTEIVAETDKEFVGIMAALPEAASAEIAEALSVAKIHVTRADIAVLGWMWSLWPRLCETDAVSRRLVLFDSGTGWDFVVLDEGAPVYLRGIGAIASAAELGREVTLSLLQCDSAGPAEIGEVVVCSRGAVADDVAARLAAFGPVRTVLLEDEYAGADGAARRIAEGLSLDVAPALWTEDLVESRFRRKMLVFLSIAGGLWLALMGVLFGVDTVYDFLADRQKDMRNAPRHKREYKEVSDMKDRVALIERYSDRAHSAIEILKAVSDSLPPSEDMAFRSFRYVRGESVRVQGSAGQREDLRTFTEKLEGLTLDDEADNLFEKVQQTGGENQTKKGIRFSIEAFFPQAEDGAKGGGR
ncbi:MAG: hypothetical protein ACI4Q3_02295 [Kiritimatiellia bacterium]